MNSVLHKPNWSRMGLIALLFAISAVSGVLVGTSLREVVFALVLGVMVAILYIAKPTLMVAVSLVISPLLDQASHQPLPGIGFDVASVVRGASVCGMLLTMQNENGINQKSTRWLVWASIILVVPLFMSLPLAYNPIFSLKQTLALAYWVVFTIYIYRKLQTETDVSIVIGGLFSAALIIIITMAPYEIHQTYSAYTDGSLSIYGPYSDGPFNLALSIAFWIPLFFVLRTRKEQIVYVALVIVLLDILLHTYVRTSMMVVLICLLYTVLGNKHYRKVGIAAIGALGVALVFHDVQAGWLQRFQQSSSLNGLSSGRLQLYTVAVHRFIDMDPVRKVVGIGFGNAPVVMESNGVAFNTDPQNDFLNTLLSAGVLGLIGLIIYLIVLFMDTRHIKDVRYRRTATVVFTAILVTAMINGIYSGETTAMIFAITTIGVARFYGNSQQRAAQS